MFLLHLLKDISSFVEGQFDLYKDVFLDFTSSPNMFWISALCFAVSIPSFGYLVFVGCKSSPFSFYSFSWFHITASQFTLGGVYMNLVWLPVYFYSPFSWSRSEKPLYVTGFVSTLSFLFLFVGSYSVMYFGEADSTNWNFAYYVFQFCGLATLLSNAGGFCECQRLSIFDFPMILGALEVLVWRIMKKLVVLSYICAYFGLVWGFVKDMAHGTRVLTDFNVADWGIFVDFILFDIVVLRILNEYRSFKGLGKMETFKLIFVPGVMLCDVLQGPFYVDGSPKKQF